jgi:hypothetical protein
MAGLGSLTQRGQEIVLGVLLVVLGGVLWWVLWGGGAPGAPGTALVGGGRADLAGLKVYPVDWAALTAPRPAYDPNGRNIFQFGAIPAPTPPPLTDAEKAAIEAARRRAAAEEAARQLALQQQQQATQQQAAQQQAQPLTPPPPPRPQPPPVPYKFIGYVGPPERKIAVLHDGTDFLFARRGEVVGGKFRIVEIGYETIKFGFTDPQFKGDTQTIPMSSSF